MHRLINDGCGVNEEEEEDKITKQELIKCVHSPYHLGLKDIENISIDRLFYFKHVPTY